MLPLCESIEAMVLAFSSLEIPSEMAISSTKLRPGLKNFPRERGLYGGSRAKFSTSSASHPASPEGGMGKSAESGPV